MMMPPSCYRDRILRCVVGNAYTAAPFGSVRAHWHERGRVPQEREQGKRDCRVLGRRAR